MRFLLIGLMIATAGCAFGQVRPNTIKQLEEATTAKHLHFDIRCSPLALGEETLFVAWANVPGHDSHFSIENGGQPDWNAYGRTQQEAAEHLLLVLRGKPNGFPKHEPAREKGRSCPPPIEGGLPE